MRIVTRPGVARHPCGARVGASWCCASGRAAGGAHVDAGLVVWAAGGACGRADVQARPAAGGGGAGAGGRSEEGDGCVGACGACAGRSVDQAPVARGHPRAPPRAPLPEAGREADRMNENLAKARAAALNDIKLTDDQPAPTWRVIITDSESPTGLAPVCTGERSDALHMIDDYP